MSLSKWSRLGQAAEAQKRFATFQRRMAPGSFGGRTELASPVTPLATGQVSPVRASGAIPALHLYKGVSQAQLLGHDVETPVSWAFQTETPGQTTFSWVAGNPSRISVVAPCRALVVFWFEFDVNAVGQRLARLEAPSQGAGCVQPAYTGGVTGGRDKMTVTATEWVTSSWNMVVHAIQTSGGSLFLSRGGLSIYRMEAL